MSNNVCLSVPNTPSCFEPYSKGRDLLWETRYCPHSAGRVETLRKIAELFAKACKLYEEESLLPLPGWLEGFSIESKLLLIECVDSEQERTNLIQSAVDDFQTLKAPGNRMLFLTVSFPMFSVLESSSDYISTSRVIPIALYHGAFLSDNAATQKKHIAEAERFLRWCLKDVEAQLNRIPKHAHEYVSSHTQLMEVLRAKALFSDALSEKKQCFQEIYDQTKSMQKKPPFPLSNTLRIINQIQLAEAIYELSNLEKNVLSNPERIYDLFHANTLLDEIKETDQAFAHYLRGQVKLSFAEELRDFPCWAKAGAVVSCTSKRALSPPPPLC